MIYITHYSKELLGSNKSLASGSELAGATDMPLYLLSLLN